MDEWLSGGKSLAPAFARDTPGLSLTPFHYLLVQHANMTRLELLTAPPGSALTLAAALQRAQLAAARELFERPAARTPRPHCPPLPTRRFSGRRLKHLAK